ncbi:hypothetical protein SmJEL517_g01415 [Synchytrium microbalum]|uniref:C2 domain-containing protein n=1 Tax=Synchytrium microbalum TaxID=1806994 RepID=A0A507CF57_9FUNG|nr:uncharacterized protein SmJEL517_g01415 [Synchytrium microbalum]TPX36153.1 hypothetical protein SmJEL517_g01415 [Synchytrium microbalum]
MADYADADRETAILERARKRVQERRERRNELTSSVDGALSPIMPRSSSPTLITDQASFWEYLKGWSSPISEPVTPRRGVVLNAFTHALVDATPQTPSNVSPSRYHRRSLSRGLPLEPLHESPASRPTKSAFKSNSRANDSIANLVSKPDTPRRQSYKRRTLSRQPDAIESDDMRNLKTPGASPKLRTIKGGAIAEVGEQMELLQPVKTEEEEIMEIAQLALQSLSRNFIEFRKWGQVSLNMPMDKIFYPLQLIYKPGSDAWMTIYEGLRFPEEEGLYVAPPPNFSAQNIQKMERRLRGSEPNYARDWFNPPHRMIIDAPALVSQPPRPYPILHGLPPNPNSELAVEIRPRWQQSLHRSIESGSYMLVLELSSVRFDDHPLMNDEMRVARELESTWRVLKGRNREEVVEFCQRKVEALHAAYNQYKLDHPRERGISEDGIYSARPVSAESVKSSTSGYAHRLLAERAEADKQRKKNEVGNRFKEMRQDLKNARLLRDTESQTSRLLEFKILKLWQELQRLRAQQGYSTSSLKLTVKVTEPDMDADVDELEQDVWEEVEELRDEWESEQEERMNAWSQAYKEWEALEKERHSIMEEQGIDENPTVPSSPMIHVPQKKANETKEERRTRKLAERAAKAARAESGQLASPTSPLLEKHAVPVKPKREVFKEAKAKALVLKRLETSRRPVGTPTLSLQVKSEHTITAAASLPRTELARRTTALSTQFHLRLYYNDKEVARTESRPLDPDTFELTGGIWEETTAPRTRATAASKTNKQINPVSGMTVGLLVKEEPEKLRIAMFESGTFGDTFVCELLPPLPPPAQTALSRGRARTELPFSGRPYKIHTHLKPTRTPDLAPAAGPNMEERCTKGVISVGLCWGVGPDGQSLGPSESSRYRRIWNREHDKQAQIAPLNALIAMPGLGGQGNVQQITDWISNARLDPNDPRNVDLLQFRELLQMGRNGPWKDKKVFRFNISQKLIDSALGVGHTFELDTKRNALLIARNAHAASVRGPIPYDDNEILESQWDRVPHVEETPMVTHALQFLTSHAPPTHTQDNLNDAKNQLSLLKRVRAHHLLRSARSLRPKRVSDYVKETSFLATQATMPTVLSTLFRPYRPLRPYRDPQTDGVQMPDRVQLIFQVARALNVPVRSHGSHASGGGDGLVTVKPFVEISFQSQRARTTCSEGPNPIWDETLSLDVQVPNNDFRPDMLMESELPSELIWFHLFDEIIIDLVDDERDRNEYSHFRRERNWLGCFSVPFASVYEQVRVEGSFCVRVPPATVGYERSSLVAPDAAVMVGVDPPQGTLLHVFMVLEPPLSQLGPLNLVAQSDDSEKILNHAEQWTKSLSYLNRPVMATALTLAGKTALLPHFLRPYQPPEHLTSPSALLAWTSSIPYLHFRAAVGSSTELWSSVNQVVEMGCADQAEHAIWLCNFLLGSGREAYIVLGSGPSHTRGWFVAVREDEWGPGIAVNEGGQAVPQQQPSVLVPTSPTRPKSKASISLPVPRQPGSTQIMNMPMPYLGYPQQRYSGYPPMPMSPMPGAFPTQGYPANQGPWWSNQQQQQQQIPSYPPPWMMQGLPGPTGAAPSSPISARPGSPVMGSPNGYHMPPMPQMGQVPLTGGYPHPMQPQHYGAGGYYPTSPYQQHQQYYPNLMYQQQFPNNMMPGMYPQATPYNNNHSTPFSLTGLLNSFKSLLHTGIMPRSPPAGFGFGPQGPFIIDRKHAWRIVDAVSGDTYSVRDAHCPLKRIGCVFNHENIWANIQQTDDPRRVQWDTSDQRSWRPFFTKSFPLPPNFESIQPISPSLHIRPSSELRDLEQNIERTLISSIETWRGRKYTRWNRLCSRTFDGMLSRFEDDVAAGLGPTLGNNSTDLSRDWKALTNVYCIRGFPIRVAYADMNGVVNAVRATDVFSAGDPKVEFALAVGCRAYPGGFVVVWVYVASLIRNE